MDYEQEIDNCLKPMRIIWFALFFSLFTYLAIALFASSSINIQFDEIILKYFRFALYSFSFITIISTIFIHKLILKNRNNSTLGSINDIQSLAKKYNVAMIISLALSESIGIYGLILFFVSKNLNDLYLLILISAISMLFYFPKKSSMSILIQDSMQ